MASKAHKIRPSDLPTKMVRSANGETIKLKVIQSESPTLANDLLAAFQSNVRRITTERRKQSRARKNTAET